MKTHEREHSNTDEHDAGLSMKGAFRSICVHLCSCASLLVVTGCAVGPDYKRPDTQTPTAYKEAGDWIVAKPQDAAVKGKWWRVFNDPLLDGLMEQVSVSNQTLAAAEARYR